MKVQKVAEKIWQGGRITDDEFLFLDKKADLNLLGALADSVRIRLHPENVVTYVIDRNINYTDICISACKFCAFFSSPGDEKG